MRKKLFFLGLFFLFILSLGAFANQDTTPPPPVINGDISDVGMIALVIAITQAVKKGIEKLLGHDVAAGFAVVISVLVAFFAVAITALQIGHPFNLNLLIHFGAIVLGANGGFLLLQKILGAIGLLKK
jgi:hypothetical protein